jgi:hypothetical protein
VKILGVLSAILGMAGKLRELVMGVNKVVLTSVVAAVSTTVVLVGGYLLVVHLNGPAASGLQQLGGLDFARYCESYGYQTNDQDSCSSDIDLNKACSWQYNQDDLHYRFTSDVYSAECYTAKQELLGGISNMLGYCRTTFKSSADVRPAVVGQGTQKRWVCSTGINKKIACNWQYQKEGVKAIETRGLWGCYVTKAQS